LPFKGEELRLRIRRKKTMSSLDYLIYIVWGFSDELYKHRDYREVCGG
jgi:hypothetical protein